MGGLQYVSRFRKMFLVSHCGANDIQWQDSVKCKHVSDSDTTTIYSNKADCWTWCQELNNVTVLRRLIVVTFKISDKHLRFSYFSRFSKRYFFVFFHFLEKYLIRDKNSKIDVSKPFYY